MYFRILCLFSPQSCMYVDKILLIVAGHQYFIVSGTFSLLELLWLPLPVLLFLRLLRLPPALTPRTAPPAPPRPDPPRPDLTADSQTAQGPRALLPLPLVPAFSAGPAEQRGHSSYDMTWRVVLSLSSATLISTELMTDGWPAVAWH